MKPFVDDLLTRHAPARSLRATNSTEISMNKSLAIAFAAVLLLGAGATYAQDTKAPSTPKASQPATGMDMNAQMGRMDEQMKKMQAMHDRMANAKTPEERQKLMEEHRRLMKDSMGMMGAMMQGGMMGGTGHMGTPADPNAQMQTMQKRMDMMQMMMQMMMDQQGMTGDRPAPKK